MMERERIILGEDEQNAFMRWVFSSLRVSNFTQYQKDDWVVTAMHINKKFVEVLFDKGRLRAVDQGLYNLFIKETKPRKPQINTTLPPFVLQEARRRAFLEVCLN